MSPNNAITYHKICCLELQCENKQLKLKIKKLEQKLRDNGIFPKRYRVIDGQRMEVAFDGTIIKKERK